MTRINKMYIVHSLNEKLFFDENGKHICTVHDDDGSCEIKDYVCLFLNHFGISIESRSLNNFIDDEEYKKAYYDGSEDAVNEALDNLRKAVFKKLNNK